MNFQELVVEVFSDVPQVTEVVAQKYLRGFGEGDTTSVTYLSQEWSIHLEPPFNLVAWPSQSLFPRILAHVIYRLSQLDVSPFMQLALQAIDARCREDGLHNMFVEVTDRQFLITLQCMLLINDQLLSNSLEPLPSLISQMIHVGATGMFGDEVEGFLAQTLSDHTDWRE